MVPLCIQLAQILSERGDRKRSPRCHGASCAGLSMRMNNLVHCVVVLPGRQHKCAILCRWAGR